VRFACCTPADALVSFFFICRPMQAVLVTKNNSLVFVTVAEAKFQY